jgi:hypothetical protein
MVAGSSKARSPRARNSREQGIVGDQARSLATRYGVRHGTVAGDKARFEGKTRVEGKARLEPRHGRPGRGTHGQGQDTVDGGKARSLGAKHGRRKDMVISVR